MCPLFRGSTVRKRTTSLWWTNWLVLYSEVPLWQRKRTSGQPLYSGQIDWSQCVLYSEVHEEEDNLSIVDKIAGPDVSFIQRFSTSYLYMPIYLYNRSEISLAYIIKYDITGDFTTHTHTLAVNLQASLALLRTV